MFVNDSGELTSREAWHKAPDPVFAGGPELGLYRVLALATFSSPDGKEDWMVYNASDAPSTSFGDRDTFVQPFSFRADGTPDFGRPTPLAEALSVPSRETGSLSALTPGSPAKEFCDELYQEYCVGGRQLATMSAIDLSGVKDPLPLVMYQTERWSYPANGLDAAFHYIVPSLEPGRRYRVRLHFAELHDTQAGQRTFRVSVNEKLVLDEFDKVAAAGGPLRATVHEVLAEATPRGQIVLRFHPGTRPGADHNPTVSAIEVLPAL